MASRPKTGRKTDWSLLLGRTIAQARIDAGLTQKELCRRIGLSYSTLTKIERGVIQTPSVFTIARIARATNTSVEGLMAQVDPAMSASPTGVEMVYFSVDGVLVSGLESLWLEVAVGNDQPVSRVRHHFWRHWPIGHRHLKGDDDVASQNSRAWVDNYVRMAQPVKPLVDLMTRISRQMKVGLLSDAPQSLIDKLLKADKLPRLDYQAIVGADQSDGSHVDIYGRGQQAAGLDSGRILLVDQSQFALAGAESIGWRVHRVLSRQPSQSANQLAAYLQV